jgi:demethylmenaquinone methyltransferase/2-methoxy-6-polyprenyl-1,4-benzoquinol methylase
VYKWLHRHFPHFIDCQPIPVAELLEEGGFRIEARDELSIWGLPVSAVVARPD